MTLCWHLPWEQMYPNGFIGRDCFHTYCRCREQPFHILWRHRSESTSSHVECFILIFKQYRNISIAWKCPSMPFNNILCMYYDYFASSLPKVNFLVECQRPHAMRLMSWHLVQNVMRFALWDGKTCHDFNVMRFIFSGDGVQAQHFLYKTPRKWALQNTKQRNFR